MRGEFRSPSHTVRVERLGEGRARVSWRAQSVTSSEDFELFFAPADGGFGGGHHHGQSQVVTGQENQKSVFAKKTDFWLFLTPSPR